MKKIISLIAAVSMACSALVTSAYAADALTVESTTKILTNEEFVEFYDEDIPAGKAAYLVSFEVSGLPELGYTKTAGTNAKPKYTGSALDNMEIWLNATEEDIALIDQDYSYIVNNSLSAAPTEGFGDAAWTTNYAGNFIYPAAKDTTVVDKTEEYIQMCFVIDAEAEITFSTEGTLSIKSYTDGTLKNQDDFTTDAGNLTFSPATITLAPEKQPDPDPDPEPTAPTPDAGEGVAVTDGVNGKVWNEVKIENATLGTNYRAQFSIGDDKSTERQIFGIDENEGTVTFAVVLKTAKAVADIVLDILYDVVPQ